MGLVIGTGGIHIGTSGGGASPVKRFDAEAEYIKRKAGGTDNIGTGKAKIPTLKGKSVVWNQLVQNRYYQNLRSVLINNGLTVTDDDLGQYIISGTLQVAKSFNLSYSLVSRVSGHKYMCLTPKTQTGINYYANSNSAYTDSGTRWIGTQSSNVNDRLGVHLKAITYENAVLYFPIFIDLTLMFGAGNEPSTVAEFKAMYPLPYYDYNPGQIINNAAEAIETVGFNQWDEEVELGTIDVATGEPTTSKKLRSKNFIQVFASTNYYVQTPKNIGICFYDAGKNYISYLSGVSGAFTTPANARYMKFFTAESYGTTYNHDICINLSDAARNGQYEPYEKHTLQLGLDAFNVKDSEDNVITVNGLKSAGSVYDEIDLTRGKYIKRIGEVVIDGVNNLVGEYNSNESADRVNYSAANNLEVFHEQAKYLIDKFVYQGNAGATSRVPYTVTNTDAAGYNRMYFFFPHGLLQSATEVNTWFSNNPTTVYYELATPIEYDLVTPIGNSYKVISGGTEERLPRDTASSVMAPIKYSVKYVQPKE